MPASPSPFAPALERVNKRQAVIGVIGLGYVGLPVARAFVSAGFRVIGFDIDPKKVERLNRGESYIGHIAAADIQQMRASGFEATTDFGRLDKPDAIIICVPTPLTDEREPDLRLRRQLDGGDCAARCGPGSWSCSESTTYPGDDAQCRAADSGEAAG